MHSQEKIDGAGPLCPQRDLARALFKSASLASCLLNFADHPAKSLVFRWTLLDGNLPGALLAELSEAFGLGQLLKWRQFEPEVILLAYRAR